MLLEPFSNRKTRLSWQGAAVHFVPSANTRFLGWFDCQLLSGCSGQCESKCRRRTSVGAKHVLKFFINLIQLRISCVKRERIYFLFDSQCFRVVEFKICRSKFPRKLTIRFQKCYFVANLAPWRGPAGSWERMVRIQSNFLHTELETVSHQMTFHLLLFT